VETLAERIARDGPVSELDAIGWAIRLAKRLEGLHALGVAHGSVSPACIIAAGQDRNARAYLADVQRTPPSPAYQSPERILGGDISAADDVWGLAATLYALLTGQSPYAGGSDAEVRQKILAATPSPLAVYDVGDDDLQHILDHAFAREIGRRTAGITAFRRALEEWHPDRGVANLPPLEDEDANDDDEGGRTVYMRHTPGGALPKADQEDDEDNVRTTMRSMPKDDLAAIVARASMTAEARAAAARQVLSAPQAVVPAPPPAQPVVDDLGEDDVRTVMRIPERGMHDDSLDTAPRTILLHEVNVPPAPLPAAGQPAAPPGLGAASWGRGALGGASPNATLALPSYFEPASPGYAPPAQRPQPPAPVAAHPTGEPYLAPPAGTQKIPPGPGYVDVRPRTQNPALATLSLDTPPMALGSPYPGGVQRPYGAGSTPGPTAPPFNPQAFPAPEPGKSSKKGLILAAVIALVIAAVATFALLELRGL
jgi:hypothetical protein